MTMSGWSTSERKMRAFFCLVVCLYLISSGQCQIIKGDLRSASFTRNMDDVPAGASTLAFVFDVTGSMWDDLKQVIAGARKILDTTLSRQEKPLYDYVLIPFHDPAVGPITLTTDGEYFQKKLKNLYVQGGGDCPEMSLTAIREALEISLPGSFIYVFTDASAKDYDRLREVLQIIQRQQSQVVFVLTGDCNNRNHPGYKAYEKIAATSSGQVFIITKSDVSEVVKFIEVSVQAHKVVLLATDHSNPGEHTWEIPFDPELREVTLSLSGPNRVLRLYNPSGRVVTERDGLETLLDLETVLIVNIKNATAGKWRVYAHSSGEHSLRVTGLSTLDFQARFAHRPTLNWSKTNYQPLEGTETYILLNATGLPPPGEFREMSLRDIEGTTIGFMPLDPPPDPDQPYLYAARPIHTPQDDFYIYVHGVTEDGYSFMRATKNAILNIRPVAPSVYMNPKYPAFFDYPAEIPCIVTSLLPFNVTWSRKIGNRWLTLDQRSHHEDSTTVYYRIDEITEDAEGIYECVAVNTKGRDHGQTFLDVEERPPKIRIDGNVTVAPGRHAILTCHISSKITYNVAWSKLNGQPFDTTRVGMMRNFSLQILRSTPEDEGGYKCIATNAGGSSEGGIHLIVQSLPRVVVRPQDPQKYVTNDTLHLRCNANGYPEPSIMWLKGDRFVIETKHIKLRRGGTEIRFVKAQQEQEGVYTCQAINRAGSTIASGRLIYTEHPQAMIEEEHRLVLEGLTTTFECHAAGVPVPRIIWLKDGVQLASGPRHSISEDGILTITNLVRADTGKYSCFTGNEVGQDSDDIYLQIGTLPVIVRPPPDTGIDIGLNGYLPCVAEGYPEPEIIWSRREDQGRGDGDGLVVGVFELVIEHDDGRVYHELPSNNLVIRSMMLDDSGVYVCTARNQFGTVFETAGVDVTGLVRPRITSVDNSPHVIVGSTISLPCQITSGNPSPTRSWNRLGQEFSPSGRVQIMDDGRVVITDARVSDAGEYVCIATNVAGEYSDRTDLDVWEPPTISTPANGYTTIEGRSISLECKVTGNPKPNIQWTKSGIRGPLRYLPDYDVRSDGTLVISNAVLDHTGLYTCIATNQAGRASVEADLVVFYKPRTEDGAINEYTVVEGNSITMDCPVTKSNPPPTFTWYFEEKELIHSTGRYEMSDDGHLRIVSARLSDDGVYRCSATNAAGSVSHDMSLNVHVPPHILRSPDVIRGLEGEDASIECEATGIPLPTLQWRKNNAEIIARGRISITSAGGYTSSSMLQIRPSRLTDDGEFVCVAKNIAGKDTSATLLDIQKRPTIDPNQFSKNLTPSRGSQLSIPCVAYGDPTPTIRWFHNDRELRSEEFDVDIASNGTLTLYSVESEDTGSYRCEAENYLDKVTWEARVTVYEPPEITNSDETTKLWVFEGEPAVMLCHAEAVPKPTTEWYKVELANNMLLEDEVDHISIRGDGDVFNITKSRLSDAGNYICAASNVEGTSNKYFQLDVYVLPSIPSGDQTSNSRVVLGDDFTLECRAGGIPYPRIRWYKGLKKISAESEDIHIDNRGQTLTVLNSDLMHDGEYRCVADNIVGDAEKFFDVTILVPASIDGGDMEHTIQVSRYLVMECRASGIPKPDILWYKDGRAVALSNSLLESNGPVILDDGRYFEFSRIRVQDAGVYICLASNEAGRDSKTHTVTVQVPPDIASDDIPANISVVKGDDVTLNCYATGDPPPTIIWLKNGVAVSSGGRYSISNDNVYLTINDAVESDRGQYTCQATNDAGVVTQNQYLDVLVPPEIGGPESETITVEKGETVNLDCIIIGNPTPLIRWEKDGRDLEESDRITITGDGQRLTITQVEEGDASGYTCHASNIISSDSKAFELYVTVRPAVLPFKKEVYEVIEHEKISITCAASGIPEPKIAWFKGTQAISKSKFFKFREDGHELVILKADVDVHDGNYSCVASNDVGYDSREVTVSVLIQPSIFGQDRVVNKIVDEGNEVVMECKVRSGKPEPAVLWFNGDQLISKSDSLWRYTDFDQTLSTGRARLDNTGDYWCLVSNIAGKARKNFTLDVQVKPFVEGEKVEDKNVILGNDVMFKCKVSGIPWPELIWTKDGVTIPSGPDWLWKFRQTEDEDGVFRLTVYNSREQDKGEYKCLATNDAGQDEKLTNLDVYLPPTFDGNEILDVTVLVGENAELFCDVNAFPVPTIWWYKDGRTVFPSEASRNDKDFVLAIREAQLSDAGLYECAAINVAGNTSRLFRLKVHSAPKVFGPSVDEITKLIGEQIDMVCDIHGVPAPTLTWTRNGHPLEIDETRMTYLSGNKIIRIFNAQLSDTGQYECHGINEEGRAVKSFDVTIHEPARIIGNEPEYLDVNKDGNFQLECVVTGTPKPVIEWLKDGRHLVLNSRYEMSDDGRYLNVKDVRERDAGRYVCNASNVESHDQKPFTVNVRVAPTIDEDYENLWIIEGQNINLTCNPRSNSPMEITWSYNGQPMSSLPYARPSLQGKRLQLFNVQREYAGAYQCTAANPAGSISKSIDLDVHSVPVITNGNITDTYRVIKGEYKTLECDVSGNPTPDIQWLKDFYPIYFNPDGRTIQGNYEIQNNGQTFTLYDAQVYDEGTYKCRASNNAGFASKEYNIEILVPPQIHREGLRKNIVAREKSYVRIQCATSGLPTPTIRWLKDGNEVIATDTVTVTNHFEDHHSFLTLNGIVEDEAGMYSCVADNLAGRDIVDIEIVVNVPPKIRDSDKHAATPVEVVVGDTLDLECEVIRGTPEPEIHWWKRSRKLMESDRLKILAKGRYLRIPQAKSDDYGVYTCIARNVEGGDSKNFNVKVLEPPKFEGDDDNNVVDVILGFSHFITCDIAAQPQPSLSWLKDGRPFESDNNIQVDHNGRVLLIKSARLLDEGTYTCVASNKAGSDEKSTAIRILTPPTIHDSSDDNDVDVLLNEPTYLNCTVSGFPRPEINWFKNGIKIDFSDENFKTHDDEQILSIGRAQLEDSGRYDCHARNTAGRDRKDFVLTVQVSPSISGPGYEDLLLLEGRYYELDCYSTGIPTPKNKWFKEDTVIRNSQRYSLFNKGSTLGIFQADERDNGILSCLASNVAGTAEKTFNITVLVSPKLVDSSKYKDLHVNQGRQVTLDCASETQPPPSVTWIRNGREIRPDNAKELEYGRIEITSGGFQLIINDAKPDDVAQYSCELSNDAGVDSRKFNVIVNTPPEISGPKSETVVKPVDSTLSLDCNVQGYPTPRVSWYKGNMLMEFSERAYVLPGQNTLRIDRALVSDAGVFTCVASNVAGVDNKNITVDILVPPVIDNSDGVDNLDVILGDSFQLSCPVVESNPAAEVLWYKDGVGLISSRIRMGERGQTLLLPRAEITDAGEYTCVAKNEVGEDDRSFSVNILVPPGAGLRSVSNHVEVNETFNALLECDVTGGNPPPQITWMYNDNPIQLSRRMRLFADGRRLEISRSLVSDSGNYKCTAANPAGSVSDTIRLSVYIPPAFENGDFEDISLIEGNRLELDCTVDGIPTPKLAWTKSMFGETAYPLYEGRVRFSQDMESASIDRAVVDDSGLYTCVASSIAGQVHKQFNVSVHVPPSINVPIDNDKITVVQGDPFMVDCPVTGDPVPEIVWFKNGRPLPLLDVSRIRNNGQQLYIESAQLGDVGTYTCIARSVAGEDNRNFDVDVLVPPNTLKNEVNITATSGSDVKMECHSDAIPPPSFSWYKNGRPLGHYGHLLLLKGVEVESSGSYTCETENEAGKAVQRVNLNVYEKPTISPGLSEVIALLHETVKFNCISDGVPEPTITWWKDSKEITPESTSKYRIEGNSLEITDVLFDDGGEYMCLAANDAGSDVRRISLRVHEKPSIARGETNITVIANEPVTLPCEASGTPFPIITWTKDSRTYRPNTKIGYRQSDGGSVHISAASIEDTGSYSCYAKNDAGSTKRDIRLFVQVPPSIANTVTKYVVEPFTRLRIPCDVYGVPRPGVKWTRDGYDADKIVGVYFNQRDNSLDIPSVGTLHEAVYTCTASNAAGTTSYNAEVKVQTVPTIANPKRTVSALEGTTVVLPCDASGTPDPVVYWRRGAQLLEMDLGRYSLEPDKGLRIGVTEVSDTATYTCVAQNVAGTAFGQVHLNIHVLPQILTDMEPSVTAIAGQPFTFTIGTSGIPRPSVQWLKNEFPLGVTRDDSRFVLQESGSLHIPIVIPNDQGLFNVTAGNIAGTSWLATQLSVMIPPEIRSISSNITAVQGGQIPLDVVADGRPTPIVTWTKDGEPLITNSDRFRVLPYGSVIIDNAMSTDAGYYVATAINKAGRDSTEFQVIVHVPPTFTTIPSSKQIMSGDNLELHCSAAGFPVPTILWKVNGLVVPGLQSILDGPGSSRIMIKNIRSEDAGSYTCEAFNPVGRIFSLASITVDSPPFFVDEHVTNVVGKLGETTRIDCPVSANPIPTIIWTKNSQRITLGGRFTQLRNGSLLIHTAMEVDAGDYKCTASNDAGSVERVTKLILQNTPTFLTKPSDVTAFAGATILFNCTAAGEPQPTIEWRRSSAPLPVDGRFNVLRNYSLQVAATQLQDTGEYACIATNYLGSKLAKAFLTVKVNGQFGDWKQWGACSVTCGTGTQTRIRYCNSPSPSNGGSDCQGPREDTRPCLQGNCPVHGKWSDWGAWEECSVTCGQGHEMRTRECNNPPSQYGGLICSGDASEKRLCSRLVCPIHGKWGTWGVWQPCSETCGEGVQLRVRACNNPTPALGGDTCRGSGTTSRICNLNACPVGGNWGRWAPFRICSVSCGGGTRDRIRTCSDPPPSYGGELCPGSNIQIDNCNPEPCPLNGNWADWGTWTTCSRSCGGGNRRRYRSCSQPRPRYGGRYCSGSDTMMQSCGLVPCPDDGQWSEWGDWTPCGVTCGSGTRNRRRACSNPPPRYNGKQCQGDGTQTDQCVLQLCPGGIRKGVGTIFGNVNDIPLTGSEVESKAEPIGDNKIRITSVIRDIPRDLGPHLRNQVSILTPIYWTMAKEIDGAYNGYTLTGGNFERTVMVEFPGGQTVHMHHNAKGVDQDGNLMVDIQINGEVPMFPANITLNLKDYIEDYLQTGPDSIYAFSDRFYTVNEAILLYHWNHTIFYDSLHGEMPYLVEQLFATDIEAKYDPKTLELHYRVDVSIGKGDPSNECPYGFVLDVTGQYCNDEDECITEQPCSDICQNLMGSYICECKEGFHIGSNGNTCEDIDECDENMATCEAPLQCHNTRGSYKCILACGPGLRTTNNGLSCEDVDECSEEGERLCEHLCNNTYGSYRCHCRAGYQLADETSCEDIDECRRGACGGDITQCFNTPGSYYCTNSCPSGFYLDAVTDSCIDEDECTNEVLHHCQHKCENVDGSYRCICHDGYVMQQTTGICVDLNECSDGKGPCQYACRNIEGSYRCYCPPGYRINANRHSCRDIDECLEGDAKCFGGEMMCANTLGSYKCVSTRCPAYYTKKNGLCTRDCLDDECPSKFKSIIRYNSTFLRVGVPENQDLLELAVSYVKTLGELELHKNTRFRLLTPPYERAWRLFGLRVINEERGIIYTKMPITRQFVDWYRLRVSARSTTIDGAVEYETIFSLFINVAPNPFA